MTAILALLFAFACGNPTGPQASDYDSTCSVATDCEPVVQRPGCCGCSSWVALNTSEAQAFEDDQERFWDRHQCGSQCALGCFDLPEQSSLTVTCDAGTCVVDAPDTGLP